MICAVLCCFISGILIPKMRDMAISGFFLSRYSSVPDCGVWNTDAFVSEIKF